MVVIGAGMAGLAAAVDLAAAGLEPVVLERAEAVGGKMRAVRLAPGRAVDGGPTVFTMRWVFDALFQAAGAELERAVPLRRAEVLARHAWAGPRADAPARLDLHADPARAAEAIAAFAGADEARRHAAFAARARRIFDTLDGPFMRAERPGPLTLAARVAAERPLGAALGDLAAIAPLESLWAALGRRFRDPRLRQLYARYATYCGSSPFAAPATLMLVAHAEAQGVWMAEGGMRALAQALGRLAERAGARIRTGAHAARILTGPRGVTGVALASGERIAAAHVVAAGDVSALGAGLLGEDARAAAPKTPPGRRSLSAVVWTLEATTRGFPLARHTVFFAEDYRAEFRALFKEGRAPEAPTIYVCAEDRDDAGRRIDGAPEGAPERLQILMNAPATGDAADAAARWSAEAVEACRARTMAALEARGLTVTAAPGREVATSPLGFHRLFPGTGGALYGRANHGALGSFARPGAATAIPGLYLAGGSAHPAPGAPMAALSGRIAAARLLADRAGERRAVRVGRVPPPPAPEGAAAATRPAAAARLAAARLAAER